MQPWALCIQITEVDTHHTIVLKPNIPKLEVYIYINFHILIKKKTAAKQNKANIRVEGETYTLQIHSKIYIMHNIKKIKMRMRETQKQR